MLMGQPCLRREVKHACTGHACCSLRDQVCVSYLFLDWKVKKKKKKKLLERKKSLLSTFILLKKSKKHFRELNKHISNL